MVMTVDSGIKSLVKYAVREGLIDSLDEVWATNRILEILDMDAIDSDAVADENADLQTVLGVLLQYAVENGLCEDSVVFKDLFDTKLMGALTPAPSVVINKFYSLYEESPLKATEYYYHLSRKL